IEKVKEFQRIFIQNIEKVEEPTREIFDRIYKMECKVKKDKNRGIKVGTELLITYSELAR
ncbi:4513_t:CDS:1, partial [Gigaspora rosea]